MLNYFRNNITIIKITIIIVICLCFFPCHSYCQIEKNPFSTTRSNPEPANWYAGDIHIHRSCGGDSISVSELRNKMEVNDLAVISVLADMGNSQAKDRIKDLMRVELKDNVLSAPGRIIHWAAEWHWDADEWSASHQALGGHLVLLGVREAHKIWDESPYKVLDWASKQNAVCGFAHMQYLNNQIPDKLNCCIPLDYPVEVALGTVSFISEDCQGSDAAINGYYRLLNCGFRPGLAAGTDFPCNGGAPFGSLLTYVQVTNKPLSYYDWIEGIRKGRTVVSRNGHNEFLELKVNDSFTPGDEFKFKVKGLVTIEVKWTSIKELTGRIELVCNGKVISGKTGMVKPGEPVILKTTKEFSESSWICARRMDESGHQSHTAPVYITVNNKPVRASAEDAQYFVKWIDNILNKIAPGGIWNSYFTHDLDKVQIRYQNARDIYRKIRSETQTINN